ncbi:MAG TPA: prephenate dehydrogenase/arogenate dehydrogenase family protein, partial [bacterium]|nr:prephenate dehydrogenase/arogenate dehydrogenase family protein [bacterium]
MSRGSGRKKIAILGVGLLGGSLALALRKQKKFSLLGWNHRPASRHRASKIVPMAATLDEALRGADVVLLCTHSSEVLSLLPRLPERVSPDALILDVSSVKGAIVEKASRFAWAPYHFVPCHPMAGKEKSGPENAEAGLYAGKVVFITPLPGTPRAVLGAAVSFWRGVGALPQVM